MTKEGQTYYWRTFDDKTGTATIVVPAPPVQTGVQTGTATQPSVPQARVARAPQPEGAIPTAAAQAPRIAANSVAPPEPARPAAERSTQDEASATPARPQVPSSPADGPPRARTPPAPPRESAFMVVNVAPGDVLNVRTGPSVAFEVVGGLPPAAAA
jgi:hypothetical protein